MNRPTIGLIILVFALAVVLTACGGQDDSTQSIVGTTWNWEAFQDSGEVNNITVPDPEKYTLTLNEDGTASIKADCNQVTWPYELDGNKLTFNTLGPSTLAICEEGSLDTQFLQMLGETATYVTDQGKLNLNLKADAGNMVFSS